MTGDHSAKSRTWTARGHAQAVQDAQRARAERVKELLAQAGRKSTSAPSNAGKQDLPPSSTAFPLAEGHRYRRTLAGEDLLSVIDGIPFLEILRRTSIDHRDRVVIAWPFRPDNGLIAAALYLLEGRARGDHAQSAVGLWPWRNAMTRTGNYILVEPSGLIRCAQAGVQVKSTATPSGPFATRSYDLAHLRLQDLAKQPPGKEGAIIVRRPSLLEITSVFPPSADLASPYALNAEQVLQRVRRYTDIKELSGATLSRALGDPLRAPFAVFGLPADDDALLRRCLTFGRFTNARLDSVIVDLTRTSLNHVGETWPRALRRLFATLETLKDQRPGVVALTEDAFTLRKAEAAMGEVMKATRSRRPFPERKGLFLNSPGFLGTELRQVQALPPITFRADLKESRLLVLRDDVLRRARELENNEDARAAAALRGGLAFVRAMANLPIGLEEARSIIEVMHATEDEADRAVRRKFYVADALRPLAEAIQVSASADILDAFRRRFVETVESWRLATPASAKLAAMAEKMREKSGEISIVLPDRHVANLYRLSDSVLRSSWRVAEPKTMIDVARAHGCSHWVVVRPTGETLRNILTSDPGPRSVDVVGDAAGSALLEMELKPLTSLDAFSHLRERASSLIKAIGRSVANLELDHEEVRSRVATISEELDFTQSGGSYTGDRIRILTERGYALVYRPSSEVLRHTPDDLRAFEKADAREIREGEEVLVLTNVLMELLRRELSRAPRTVETLRAYHASIAERRDALPGTALREKARLIMQRIRSEDPDFGDNEISNVSRWLDVDGSTLDDPEARPQAPRTRQRYTLFMNALGVPPVLAATWWDHGIRLTRSYRLSEGLQFNQRATGFVLDPESLSARSSGRDLGPLQQAVIDNVDIVKRTEVLHASRRT